MIRKNIRKRIIIIRERDQLAKRFSRWFRGVFCKGQTTWAWALAQLALWWPAKRGEAPPSPKTLATTPLSPSSHLWPPPLASSPSWPPPPAPYASSLLILAAGQRCSLLPAWRKKKEGLPGDLPSKRRKKREEGRRGEGERSLALDRRV